MFEEEGYSRVEFISGEGQKSPAPNPILHREREGVFVCYRSRIDARSYVWHTERNRDRRFQFNVQKKILVILI